MLTQDEFFQYLEDIYVQQAHCLESLKSYVRLSDDDPDVAVTGAASRTKSPLAPGGAGHFIAKARAGRSSFAQA